ncbi:MAG TPA: PLP-dependent aminotransferase family protein [Planctomycetaceae bacterium]|nr:PLP-dependent aminotransferase family protein [Planctomycetaceae bacterium]
MSMSSSANSSAPTRLSQRWHWGSKQPISFLMEQAVQNPSVISLAAGLVDQTTLPDAETKEACAALLADQTLARQALQYGTTQGAERLRKQLIRHLAVLEGCPVDKLGITPEQLILTTGSQQLLSLVGEVLLDPGDVVLVAAPTYFAFLGTLNGQGARSIPVAADADGMQTDALEVELQKLDRAGELPRVKLIYVVSYYENPTGISLSAARRQKVVEIARRWSRHQRIFVLEDAAYRELRYDGAELPSVWSFDAERQTVILAQTFSKSFSPGLRVGYGVVPRDLVPAICDRKGNEDFGSANFNQHLLATIFEQGLYARHVRLLQETYRSKRDAMLTAADRYFGKLPGVTWVHPHGGLYVWMTLPTAIATGFESPLFRRAMQVDQVMYVPGEVCYAGPVEARPRNQMRLSYGTQTVEGIDEGMKRLASAVKAVGNF